LLVAEIPFTGNFRQAFLQGDFLPLPPHTLHFKGTVA